MDLKLSLMNLIPFLKVKISLYNFNTGVITTLIPIFSNSAFSGPSFGRTTTVKKLFLLMFCKKINNVLSEPYNSAD